jgi:hypothetical protein
MPSSPPITVAEISRVMDTLFAHRASGLPPEGLSEVFDRLVWCLDDNGSALLEVCEQWLVSGERARVEIVLAMTEVFPFRERAAMEAVLERVAAAWPDLAERCDSLRDTRRHSGS